MGRSGQTRSDLAAAKKKAASPVTKRLPHANSHIMEAPASTDIDDLSVSILSRSEKLSSACRHPAQEFHL